MDRIDADLCRLVADLGRFGTDFDKFGVALYGFETNVGNIVSNLVLISVIMNPTWVPEDWEIFVSTMNFNVFGMEQIWEQFDSIGSQFCLTCR